MPIGTPDPFWNKVKVRNKFMKLCNQAVAPSVKWKKFKKLDEDNMFSKYPDAILSQQFRKIRFQRLGLCYTCGINKPVKPKGRCDKCQEFTRSVQRKALHAAK